MNPLFHPVRLYGEHIAWPKRRNVIACAVASLLDAERTLLDVGCGDGRLAEALKKRSPGLSVQGTETLLWPVGRPAIPYTLFDGLRLPFADGSFDACLLIDVLHHSRAPESLLAEAARVARCSVIVKDHDTRGPLDSLLMKWGDYLGNRMFGVDLPYDYRTWEAFEAMFEDAGLTIDVCDDGLKPAGALELHHHFLVKLLPKRTPAFPGSHR